MLRRASHILLAVVALLVAGPVSAQAAADGSGGAARPPAPVALAGGWSFAPDPEDRGQDARWATGGGDPRWRRVAVPHVFEPRPVEESFGGTVGWYRLRFTAPKAAEGLRWGLRFEQVRREARVWLNGREIGRHADPYVPFTLPAQGLRHGRVNTLVVRVDNRKGREPREGWWNWGGITREVSLVPRGRVGYEDAAVLPAVDCPQGGGTCRARFVVDGTLVHRRGAPARPRVTVALRAPDGTVTRASRTARVMREGERSRVRFTVPVEGDPRLWSPEDPQLYDARIETRVGRRVVQVDDQRVGLRDVDVRSGMLHLNGRAVDLRGASIQEDLKGRGPVMTEEDVELVVEELKDIGANVTRAHYLLDDRLLDRFDEEGILVWNQAPVYHRDDLLTTREGREEALETLRGTILAARPHASVVTHSVANELSATADELPGTSAFLADARTIAADLDPSVPPSVDTLSYPGMPRQEAYAAYPLIGINSYFGWYRGKKDNPTSNLADLEPYVEGMREKYPDSAFVLTEFGAESTYHGPADEKETFAFQADYVRRVLDIVDRSPDLGGAIHWTLREFAVKPDWDGGAERDVPRDPIHNKALITYDGTPKPAWDVARSDFAATPLFRDQALSATGSGAGGGAHLLALLVILAISGLITLDAWLLRGILATRRDRGDARAAAGDPRGAGSSRQAA